MCSRLIIAALPDLCCLCLCARRPCVRSLFVILHFVHPLLVTHKCLPISLRFRYLSTEKGVLTLHLCHWTAKYIHPYEFHSPIEFVPTHTITPTAPFLVSRGMRSSRQIYHVLKRQSNQLSVNHLVALLVGILLRSHVPTHHRALTQPADQWITTIPPEAYKLLSY
ncbi:hypothetical protein F4778DRAFT_178330 [Xylariomycetidae sp. FL2044]|nr:hypothetical protein F4778DRAFT_178330 [Xylariomycetidae sp. FL2044]